MLRITHAASFIGCYAIIYAASAADDAAPLRHAASHFATPWRATPAPISRMMMPLSPFRRDAAMDILCCHDAAAMLSFTLMP